MIVPVLIMFACFGAAILMSAHWLPELAAGRVGGLAFLTVCGLLGLAAGLAGLHGYLIVHELEQPERAFGGVLILADGLRNVLFEVGSLTALAAIVYLLAPSPNRDTESFHQELADTLSS